MLCENFKPCLLYKKMSTHNVVFFQRATESAPQAQLLNPMVEVSACIDNPDDKPDDFFTKFDVICATCCSVSLNCRLDTLCHQNKIQFFCGNVFGYYGYSFADLGTHEYLTQ